MAFSDLFIRWKAICIRCVDIFSWAKFERTEFFKFLTLIQYLFIEQKIVKFLHNLKLKRKYFKDGTDIRANYDLFEFMTNFVQWLSIYHFFILAHLILSLPFENYKWRQINDLQNVDREKPKW
jgi:hypothetical protein